jgi:hypothetical protein
MRFGQFVLAVCAAAFFPYAGGAQEPASAPATTTQLSEEPGEADKTGSGSGSAEEAPAAGAAPSRASLNLLGVTDASKGEARRNENVSISLIDNNVAKEINTRMGATATVVQEFRADRSYFGAEYGIDPKAPLHPAAAAAQAVHGNLNWMHNNSLTSARSFFQVGSVQPARTNDYGFTLGSRLWSGSHFTINGNQRKVRGQVNGNILVPTANERVPLTTNPADRAVVALVLAQFPLATPNRTDIDPRALNLNAPQSIDNDRAGAALDQDLGTKDRLAFRYDITLQAVEAFQLVRGQNPDTHTKNHRPRLSWNRRWSSNTVTDFTIGYDRTRTQILPDQTSVDRFYSFQNALTNVGANSQVPIDRAQNDFTYAGRLRQTRNRHTLDFGGMLVRRQVNGIESQNLRGSFSFTANFGRDSIQNLLYGTPTNYFFAGGNLYRAFRNWNADFYAGDSWRTTSRLTLTYGLRYGITTKPSEAGNRGNIPYDCDCNNAAPQIGFAYRMGGSWGILRGAYSVQYGEIFTATYGQTRLNPPGNVTVIIANPSVSDPVAGIDFRSLDPNLRHTGYHLAPELSTPYSHQYNFSWQLTLPNQWKLETGYVGSRSHKLFTTWFLNRARPVDGIALTTATVNQRRPDSRFYDIQWVNNGSHGYYDAGKLTLNGPRWHGLSFETSYWLSKAIDTGSDYTNRAAGSDAVQNRSQTEFDYMKDMKGWSNFDQPHSFLARFTYDTPRLGRSTSGAKAWANQLLGQWQVSMVALKKSGTPFGIESNSDAPGFGNVDGIRSDRPNLLDPSVLGRTINHPDTSRLMLPLSAFTGLRPGETRGNIGNTTFRKDGVHNINASLSRRWIIAGERSLSLQADSLNLTNSPQFAAPGNSWGTENFGQITNTLNDGRTFNFTLRVAF